MWMKVSKDEYELPEAIADTAKELAEMLGVSWWSVVSSESAYRHGRMKTAKYLKIEEGDEDESD